MSVWLPHVTTVLLLDKAVESTVEMADATSVALVFSVAAVCGGSKSSLPVVVLDSISEESGGVGIGSGLGLQVRSLKHAGYPWLLLCLALLRSSSCPGPGSCSIQKCSTLRLMSAFSSRYSFCHCRSSWMCSCFRTYQEQNHENNSLQCQHLLQVPRFSTTGKDPSLSLLLPFGIIYPSIFALNRLPLSSYLNSKPTCSLIKLSFLFHNSFHDFV